MNWLYFGLFTNITKRSQQMVHHFSRFFHEIFSYSHINSKMADNKIKRGRGKYKNLNISRTKRPISVKKSIFHNFSSDFFKWNI